MQAKPHTSTVEKSTPSFHVLLNYLYCMMTSTVLMQHPVLGGALFLSGQVVFLSIRFLLPGKPAALLSPRARRTLIGLTLFCGILAFTLLLIYPQAVGLERMWLLFSLVLLTSLRSQMLERAATSSMRPKMTRVQALLRIWEGSLVISAIAALILFFSLPPDTAWSLLGGYMLCTLFEGFFYSRPKSVPAGSGAFAPLPADELRLLDDINAYKTFRKVLSLTETALQVTMIMIFTYIGTNAGDMFISMAIAFVCTVSVSAITGWVARRKPGRDPSNVMLTGLFLWLISLLSFWLRSASGAAIWSYISLAACSAGTATTSTAFFALDSGMREVIFFATGTKPDGRLDAALSLSLAYAELLGQMIALIGLSFIVFFGRYPSAFEKGISFQPALLLPAVALVAFAVPAALRFPLNKRHLEKLHAFLMLKENGETNVPLQKQLEDVVINVSRQHYGIRVLMFVLRLFINIKVVGKENVKLEKGVSAVFVCNHGEIYGPIVTNLYIPFPMRPWSMSEMVDPEETTNYVYEGTFKRQKWLPEKLRMPAARFATPIINWGMHSIESIPVYRNKPRELINTFRTTVAAMEAGDNILIFPENPRDERQNTYFYLREGVGEFYTGFTMVAPLYYKKTGKRCYFVPVYADKKRHTLSFGQPTRFDPENEDNAEKARLCTYLRNEMLRMADLPEAGQEG